MTLAAAPVQGSAAAVGATAITPLRLITDADATDIDTDAMRGIADMSHLSRGLDAASSRAVWLM
jgi:hypothetical protein